MEYISNAVVPEMSASWLDVQNNGNLESCWSSQWVRRESKCGHVLRICGFLLMCSKKTIILKMEKVRAFSGCSRISKKSLILRWHGVNLTAFSPKRIASKGTEISVSAGRTEVFTNNPRPAAPYLTWSFGDTKPPSEVIHSARSWARTPGKVRKENANARVQPWWHKGIPLPYP